MVTQKSQLILPVTIVTIMIFAFLGLVIMHGELQFSAPALPEYSLRIKDVTYHCPDTIDKDLTTLPANKQATDTLSSLCNNNESCIVDTRKDIILKEDDISCTSEIIVRFFCLKDNSVKYVLDEKLSIAFLYEGQTATLSCSNSSSPQP